MALHSDTAIHILWTSNLRRTDESAIEDSRYLSDHATDMLQQYGLTLAG